MTLKIRRAEPDDSDVILGFIQALASYEKEPDAVHTTSAQLRSQLLSTNPPFRSIIAEWAGTPCGFALYFQNYSTWRGCAGIYLEDLYVEPEFRQRGIGRSLLEWLARETVQMGGERLEWSVLDWNTPALDFYRSLGAHPMSEWTTWRLADAALVRLGSDK